MDMYLKVMMCVITTFAAIAMATVAIALVWRAIEEFIIGNAHKDK